MTTNQMTNKPNQVPEIVYGYDKGSDVGDENALSIMNGKDIYTYVGKEADTILSLLSQSNKRAEIEGRIRNANDIMQMVIKHGQNVHLWDMEALVLTELVQRKKADSTQIDNYNTMITERRAERIMIDLCKALIADYKSELNQLKEKGDYEPSYKVSSVG